MPARRKPQQARAALRRATFLEVAATLIGDMGYDAVTMKAIAETARASIGTLYDYFPDKPTLAVALLAHYQDEQDAFWADTLDASSTITASSLADVMVGSLLAFVRQRPAYLPLLAAPVAYTRSTAARQPLRQTMAAALRQAIPALDEQRSMVAANIVVELIKALLATYKRASDADKDVTVDEFRKVIRLYLADLA